MSGLAVAWPLLLSVACLVFGTNLQGVLLPVLGLERGASMTAIGLLSSFWSIGFVLACVVAGWLIRSLGRVRCFLLLCLTSASCSALLLAVRHEALWWSEASWIGLRLLIGFCFGGLLANVESWLIAYAGSSRAFAGYMMVSLLASLAGTLSLDLIAPDGRLPFVLMVVATALACPPLCLMPRAPRTVTAQPRIDPLQLFRQAPLASGGVFAAGLITGAVGGLGPVFGMQEGGSMSSDTLMLAANNVGGALAYASLALRAGRGDRRLPLVAATLLGLAVSLAFIWLPPQPPARLAVLFGLFGLAQYPIYGLCVGLITEAARQRPAEQIAAELLLLFGLGTIVGPLAAAWLMHLGIGLFGATGSVLLLLLAGLLPELRQRPRWTDRGPRPTI